MIQIWHQIIRMYVLESLQLLVFCIHSCRAQGIEVDCFEETVGDV